RFLGGAWAIRGGVVVIGHVVAAERPGSPARAAAVSNGQYVYRLRAQVASSIAGGHDHGTCAVGLQATVVQPQRLGNPAAREVVLARERLRMHDGTRVAV